MESVLAISQIVVPVLVAVVAGYSSVTVAKVDKLQTSIKTNHGSKNIGHAVDILSEKVDLLSTNQEELASTLKLMRTTDLAIQTRLEVLESCQLPQNISSTLNNPTTQRSNLS